MANSTTLGSLPPPIASLLSVRTNLSAKVLPSATSCRSGSIRIVGFCLEAARHSLVAATSCRAERLRRPYIWNFLHDDPLLGTDVTRSKPLLSATLHLGSPLRPPTIREPLARLRRVLLGTPMAR